MGQPSHQHPRLVVGSHLSTRTCVLAVFCVLCFVCFGPFGQSLCFVFLCFGHAGGVCVLCFRVLAPQAAKSLRGMLTLAVTHSDSGAASDPPRPEPPARIALTLPDPS